MTKIPGFTKIGGKFSDLHFDKTFDESMQLLNGNSKRYTWLFDAIENSGEYPYDEEGTFTREWGLYMRPEKIESVSIDVPIIYKDIQSMPSEGGISQYKHYDSISSISGETMTLFKDQGPIGSVRYSRSLSDGISFVGRNRSFHFNDEGIQLDGTSLQYKKDGVIMSPYQIISLEPLEEGDAHYGTYNYRHDLGNETYAYYNDDRNNGVILKSVDNSLDNYVLSEYVLFTLLPSPTDEDGVPRTVPLTSIEGTVDEPMNCKMPVIPKSVNYIENAWIEVDDLGTMKMHLSNLNLPESGTIPLATSSTGTVHMNWSTYNTFREYIEEGSKTFNATDVKVVLEND